MVSERGNKLLIIDNSLASKRTLDRNLNGNQFGQIGTNSARHRYPTTGASK